jgi:hypothetical protein
LKQYHLTCPVRGVLPGTTCIDEDHQERAKIYPSRRISIAERKRRFNNGWEPPELAERVVSGGLQKFRVPLYLIRGSVPALQLF